MAAEGERVIAVGEIPEREIPEEMMVSVSEGVMAAVEDIPAVEKIDSVRYYYLIAMMAVLNKIPASALALSSLL